MPQQVHKKASATKKTLDREVVIDAPHKGYIQLEVPLLYFLRAQFLRVALAPPALEFFRNLLSHRAVL